MTQKRPVIILSAQSCWRCGMAIPNRAVCRRVMVTGTAQQASYGTGAWWTNEERREVVSLCPQCDMDVTREEREQTERAARRRRIWWSVIGCGFLTAVAIKNGIPWPLSLLASCLLAVLGVLGRTIVMLFVLALVAAVFGYNLDTRPDIMLPCLIITVGLFLVGAHCWRAVGMRRPFQRVRTTRERPAEVIPFPASEEEEKDQ